jgi:hypothetical protein
MTWFKNKSTRTQNNNMKCARQMWKQIFIVLTYVNMKRTWQGYGVNLCLRLVLNRLKKIKRFTFIYNPLGT